MERMEEFEESLAKLGNEWNITEEVYNSLEKFVCRLYGNSRFSSLDSLRLHLLKKRCNIEGKLDSKRTIDLGSLPPCSSTLRQHIVRSNLQIGIWKRAMENFPELPDVEEHGWMKGEYFLEPRWCDGEVLPEELTGLLAESRGRTRHRAGNR